jgi:YjbE family integral membrane protein
LDLAWLGLSDANWGFISGLITVVLIDLVLAGDNAVVIAMAVRSLPQQKRFWGICFGAGLAVALRIILTVFAAQLLQVTFVKLIGGILILWIAVKLLVEDPPQDEGQAEAKNLWQAVWIITVADVTMSTDNVLALAGASKGDVFLLLFGLGLSIPLVVGGSALLTKLMDRYPLIIYAGAAILGKVGGELIMTDSAVVGFIAPSAALQYVTEALAAIGVIIVARIYRGWSKGRASDRDRLSGTEPPQTR